MTIWLPLHQEAWLQLVDLNPVSPYVDCHLLKYGLSDRYVPRLDQLTLQASAKCYPTLASD
jgi:hypothetical protein